MSPGMPLVRSPKSDRIRETAPMAKTCRSKIPRATSTCVGRGSFPVAQIPCHPASPSTASLEVKVQMVVFAQRQSCSQRITDFATYPATGVLSARPRNLARAATEADILGQGYGIQSSRRRHKFPSAPTIPSLSGSHSPQDTDRPARVLGHGISFCGLGLRC